MMIKHKKVTPTEIGYILTILVNIVFIVFLQKIYSLINLDERIKIGLIPVILLAFIIASIYLIRKYKKQKDNKNNFVIFLSNFILMVQINFFIGALHGVIIKEKVSLAQEITIIFDNMVYPIVRLISIILLLKSLVKNLLNSNYINIGLAISGLYIVGVVSIKNWTFIALLVNLGLLILDSDSYKSAKSFVNDTLSITESEINNNLNLKKILLSFYNILFYLYIYITENIKFMESIYGILNPEFKNSLPQFFSSLFHGMDRYIILLVLFIFLGKNFKYDIKIFNKKFIKIILGIIDKEIV